MSPRSLTALRSRLMTRPSNATRSPPRASARKVTMCEESHSVYRENSQTTSPLHDGVNSMYRVYTAINMRVHKPYTYP